MIPPNSKFNNKTHFNVLILFYRWKHSKFSYPVITLYPLQIEIHHYCSRRGNLNGSKEQHYHMTSCDHALQISDRRVDPFLFINFSTFQLYFIKIIMYYLTKKPTFISRLTTK